MVHIYANGTEIALPADFSFQYNLENPFITDAEGYSMSIEVPAKAGANLDIFGMLFRLDTDISKVRYDAMIISPTYTATGVLAVVGHTESTVKLQFLQGRSADNFNLRLDDTYVNELDLGRSPLNYHYARTTPAEALRSIDDGGVAVALPWVISGSGEMIHNRLRKQSGSGDLVWYLEGSSQLTFMPYLLEIARRICSASGFTYDFTAWEQSPLRHLIICNVMPESLNLTNFAYILPHWSISEFFANLEFVLRGRFSIDQESRHISFTPWSQTLSSAGAVEIRDVISDFTITMDADPEQSDRPDFLRNRGYSSNSSYYWPIRSCDWYIRRRISEAVIPDEDTPAPPVTSGGGGSRGTNRVSSGWYYDTMYDPTKAFRNINRYSTMAELIAAVDQYRYSTNLPGFGGDALFYAADVNCFFCLYAIADIKYSDIPSEYRSRYALSSAGYYYANALMPVNDFGDYLLDDQDDADRTDLSTVPVDIIQTDTDGLVCSVPFSEAGSGDDDEIHQPKSYSLMMAGKQDRPEYYSVLCLGFWSGLRDLWPEAGLYPLTSNVTIYQGWKYELSPEGMDLRLNNGLQYGSEEYIDIDYSRTYKISFLSDSLPDPSAEFLIKGKRYICKKLTADFSASGMDRVIQGEFYRITT